MGAVPDAALAELVRSYARRPDPQVVALVGNAPVTPSPERAARIDGADLVVRINSFALDTPDGPPGLGTRTDVVALHRGVVASPWTFLDHTQRLYLLVEPGRMFWEIDWKPTWLASDLGHVPLSNDRFVLPLMGILGVEPTTAQWATTGTLLAYVLRELLPDATVLMAGFSIVDRPDQKTFEHAWGGPVEVTGEHALLKAESELLRGWADEGKVEFL